MMTTHEHARITDELSLLDIDELAISGRRHTLHQKIDALYCRAPLSSLETSRLTQLESDEIDLSTERRELHEQIDVLRAQVGLRPVRVESLPLRP